MMYIAPQSMEEFKSGQIVEVHTYKNILNGHVSVKKNAILIRLNTGDEFTVRKDNLRFIRIWK